VERGAIVVIEAPSTTVEGSEHSDERGRRGSRKTIPGTGGQKARRRRKEQSTSVI
jgi:hypothetical protein